MTSIMHSDHPFIGITYWIIRKIVGPIIKIFLIKRTIGLNNIPKSGSAILAFNHQSFFDFLCFVAIAPRNIHFLAAEKFFAHFGWRILMLLTGQIKVNRHEHAKSLLHEEIKRHVDSGKLIGIFPEGTRSPYKDELLKVFTGVAQFALRHKISVIPVGIVGTYDVMAKHMSRPLIKKIVEIHIGKSLDFHKYHGNHTDKDICLYVTEKVIREIEKLSGKKYRYYESKFTE